MPDPERPEPGGYDPVGPRPKEAVSPTGQGGPMDLALDEAESIEGIEKTAGPGASGPRGRGRCRGAGAGPPGRGPPGGRHAAR
ncbi:hypothetical protein ACFVZX_13450, partial [Streptomyces erythrochromogenes]